MARTAAKPKTNLEAVIRGEAEVRMDLELEHLRIAGDVMSRIEASDARLKDLATTAGHSFKETFLDKGTVSVSGRKERERGADEPVAQAAVINALPVAERRGLLKRGIIKMKEKWSKADNGRVVAKAF
jgi:hypothetical protein